MIGKLTGSVLDSRGGTALLLDVHGVGYVVHVPTPLLLDVSKQLAAGAVPLSVFTYMHVREDSLSLYGFAAIEELQGFEELLGVKGMGPRAALKILSNATIDDLKQLAREANTKRLTAIPGIGAKMAEAICERLR